MAKEDCGYLTNGGDNYGSIGAETPLRDDEGTRLKAGDVVSLVATDDSYAPEDAAVVYSHDKAFVMGIECDCGKDGTVHHWKIHKVRSFSDVADGENVGSITYHVKEGKSVRKFKVGDRLVLTKNDWFERGTLVTVINVDDDDKIMPYLCSDGKKALWIDKDSLAPASGADKKPEFHVGQRVRIRSFEDLAKEFGSKDCPHRFTVRGSVIFNENMERLCGRTATIKSLPESGDHILLENWSDKGGDAHWNFLTEMLEPAGFEVGQIYRSDCDGAEKGNIIRITGVSEYLIDYTPICGKINGAPWFMPLSRFCDGLVLLTGPQIEEAIRKYDAEHAEKKADVREVKRHARVGEYIKIVDADMPGIGETYKNGDIVRVIGDSDDEAGAIDIDRKDAPFVNDSEYVVLEGYKPPKNGKHVYSAIDIQTAKDFVLRTIYTLAEKDVNVILSHSSSDEDDDSAFSCYILDHDTAVDADEDTFRASAVRYSSLCSENDEPNEWIGKAVALCKALHKPLPNYVR